MIGLLKTNEPYPGPPAGIFIFYKMNQYIQITFSNLQTEQMDILIAQLADAGYEGFEETENGLKAFIKKKDYIRSNANPVQRSMTWAVVEFKQGKYSIVLNENFTQRKVLLKFGVRSRDDEKKIGRAHV